MNLINLNVKKFFGWIFLIIINYFLIIFLIYILSAILLVNKITPNIKLISEYQRNYYNIGLRNIWHSQPECIEFSNSQIYTPKDAFNCFMGTDLDILVIGNCYLRKENQNNELKKDYKNKYELD